MAGVILPISFVQGLSVRASGEQQFWTEKRLWRAQPVIRPLKLMYYYVPFYHFGAVWFAAGGAGYLLCAFLQQNSLAAELGLFLSAWGSGAWLGVRLKDFRSKG